MDPAAELQTSSTESARIVRALDKARGIMIPGEAVKAVAVQRRYKALTRRRVLVIATTGRLLIINRGLLGGFDVSDLRWQDLTGVHIQERIFGTTLTISATPGTAVLKAVATGSASSYVIEGLRKDQAQQVYVVCQSQEQAWREKNRVRELEELRAKSGGIQLAAGGSGAAAGSGDATARLQQAKEMLDKGLITDAEYEAIKAKVFAGF